MTHEQATEWVDRYLHDTTDLDRVVTTSSGLDAHGILAVLEDPRLRDVGIHAMSDLMHPTASMYYDAIYGAFHGQVAIRNWLVPTMAEIDFIEFVPQQPSEVFTHADGGSSSIDEWQMWADLGGERIPLPRGVSTRHYADGWISWNADVYDTGPFRVPPPEGTEALPLPDPPPLDWVSRPAEAPTLSTAASEWVGQVRRSTPDTAPTPTEAGLSHDDLHAIIEHPDHTSDPEVLSAVMHPEARYLDPLFGDFHGRDAIRSWLRDVLPKIGRVRFDPIGPVLFNGSCAAFEWVQMAIGTDGEVLPMMRGTSVRRFEDGWVMYLADYFDTATLADPSVLQAAAAAGSTLRSSDIARYRTAGTAPA